MDRSERTHVRTPPADLDTEVVTDAAASGWGLRLAAPSYVALGGGSHHWTATTPDGVTHFLTVDDLLDKPWLGADAESVFRGLLGTYGAACKLRETAGLPFILAPLPSIDGQTARRLTPPRYSLAVFPFVPGQTGRWGDDLGAADRDQILRMIAELHNATPAVNSLVRRRAGEVYERADLEKALAELDQPWDGGPFSEPAREALAEQSGVVAGWLAEFGRLEAYVAARVASLVITHGEPHGGNVMRVGDELLLIDWDTVALAPAERDLWMLDDGTPEALTVYTQVTGTTVDATTLSYYRLAWRLADLAGFTRRLRSVHQRDGDSERAWESLRIVLASGPTGWNGPFHHLPRPSQ
ncbi:MAG: phosphotransferase [Nocardiopsaceae bacterium]|jgi:spectinomycin phosphotransferase|nr:phosphotransferase [Nocardiopsaceae bacterium]